MSMFCLIGADFQNQFKYIHMTLLSTAPTFIFKQLLYWIQYKYIVGSEVDILAHPSITQFSNFLW